MGRRNAEAPRVILNSNRVKARCCCPNNCGVEIFGNPALTIDRQDCGERGTPRLLRDLRNPPFRHYCGTEDNGQQRESPRTH
jgi:hypothetical protein